MEPMDSALLALTMVLAIAGLFTFLIKLGDRKERRRHRNRAEHGTHRSA